jgi:hypothetical protein
LAAKQVELLTQAFPDRTRLAVLYDEISAYQFAAAERQARLLRLDVQSLKLENPPYDFDAAFRSLAEGSPQMLLVLSSSFFTLSRSHIAELAIQFRPDLSRPPYEAAYFFARKRNAAHGGGEARSYFAHNLSSPSSVKSISLLSLEYGSRS